MKSVIISWSGGKDSALALDAASHDPTIRIVGLLTSVTREYDRVSVHGVRRSLLNQQVEQLGLPLFEVILDADCTNADYEAAFRTALDRIRHDIPVAECIAFGDLFLEDVRAYRERLLSGTGFEPLFPLWGLETAALARRFIADRFVARLVCVDTAQLDASFAGRSFDEQLLADLPDTVDPCGERGEFHTFVSDGPLFANPILYEVGKTVLREGRFMFCDIE